ncbi:hypothetical protein CAPTEDRAFT_50665, partial [Capitella teleta]
LWDRVRSRTVESIAPALVHEEGSLIKRTIRDLFDKDYDEILIQGQASYDEARDFVNLLMPGQKKAIRAHKGSAPIFSKNDVEKQLNALYSPVVNLKSGGYIVVNQTEALVAIDINSGKATREHNIEDMALSTNLEAAEEICRQLRLRDLAGLIVIDFIDMDERRNNRAVERRLRDCLREDRARIQVGMISSFGLLEMSRQRQRTGLLEGSSHSCPACRGAGYVRSAVSQAHQVVRAVSGYLSSRNSRDLTVRTLDVVALEILNRLRLSLARIEDTFGVTITLEIDNSIGSDQL